MSNINQDTRNLAAEDKESLKDSLRAVQDAKQASRLKQLEQFKTHSSDVYLPGITPTYAEIIRGCVDTARQNISQDLQLAEDMTKKETEAITEATKAISLLDSKKEKEVDEGSVQLIDEATQTTSEGIVAKVIEAVKEKAFEIKEVVEHKKHEIEESVDEWAEAEIERLEKKAEEAREKARELKQESVEAVVEKAHALKENADEWAKAAEDQIDKLTKEAKENAHKIKESAIEIEHEIAEKVVETPINILHYVEEKIVNTKDYILDTVHHGLERVEHMGEALKDKIMGPAETVSAEDKKPEANEKKD